MALYDSDVMDFLSKEELQIVEEYKPETAKLMDDVLIVRQWLKHQPHLPPMSDQGIAAFLKATNSMQECEQLMDKYFTMRTMYTELFTNRIVESKEMQDTYDFAEVAIYPLDKIKYEGYRMAFFRIKKFDASTLNFPLVMKCITAGVDMEIARTPFLKGFLPILDLTGFDLAFATKVNLIAMAHFLFYFQTIGVKIIESHIINTNYLWPKVFAVIKPFLFKEVRETLYVHSKSNMKEFHRMIPNHLLPSDYGGEMPSMAELDGAFRQRVLHSKKFIRFVETDRFKVRDIKKNKCEEMSGSFKKLAID